MSTPASALPGPAARRLEAMRAEAAAATGSVTPPADGSTPAPTVVTPTPASSTPTVVAPTATTPDPATPTTPTTPAEPQGERITLSRDEYNALRAGSEARTTAEGRAEAAALALEEANHRLTELQQASKATPQTPAPTQATTPTAAVAPDVTFTAEEEEAFAESRPYIEKVVRLVLSQELSKHLSAINEQLSTVRQTAEGAVTRLTQNNQRTFLQQVQAKVDNLSAVINHKHWGDFTDAIEPFSGLPYGALLAKNVQEEKLEQVVNIYSAFKKQYMEAPQTNPNAGYAGAPPTGSAVQTPPDPANAPKLKFSDRKKASLDYRHGRITMEELEQVKKKFDEADKLGNVDYNA